MGKYMIAQQLKVKNLGIIICAILLPAVLHAATIAVNSTLDTNGTIPNGKCSLREAIIAANTDTAVDGCAAGNGDDTILLPAGTYILTINGTDEDASMTGDLDINGNLTLIGAGAGVTIIDGNGLDRVLHVDPNCRGIIVNISGITLQNGQAPNSQASEGGGLYNCGNVTISDSVVRSNTAINVAIGGGIYNKGFLNGTNLDIKDNTGYFGGGIGNDGTLILSDSKVHGNRAAGAIGSGGGIFNNGVASLAGITIDNNAAGVDGGGLRNQYHVTLINSTVSNNSAALGRGGGIDNYSVLDVTNSTISGNVAKIGGGGISSTNLMSLANVTIANNTATTGGGGAIYMYNSCVMEITNSLMAYNSAAGVSNSCLAPSGSITSYGYNLEDDSNTCGLGATGDIIGVDPKLGPLQDNGGGTFTHALLAGSPAIDTGDPSGCKLGGYRDLLNDQRSFLRPVDGNGKGSAVCDIGSYEYEAVSGLGSDLSVQMYPVAQNGNLTYNIVVTNNGPLMAGGVVVTDPLPPNVTWVSSSTNKGVCVGSKTVICFIGPLFKGESVIPSIVVMPDSDGTVYNSVEVTATTPDPSGANNSASATTIVSALQPVRRLAGNSTVGSYARLQAAFDDSSNGDHVIAMAAPFNENVTIYSDVPITFSGGFDGSFSQQIGYSTIAGTLTFAAGPVAVEFLVVK